jgi:hypothetical protein
MRTKNLLGWIALIAIGMIVSPGYKCREYPERCDRYIKDSVALNFEVAQNSIGFQPYDTIRFESVINDTIRTRQGRTFIEAMGYPSLQLQGYRIVEGPTGAPTLTYANIEFNPLVQEGQFANYYGNGIGLLYNRQAPYNKLKASLVPGRSGLYLITIRSNNYIDYYRPEDDSNSPDRDCITIFSAYGLSDNDAQINYWDSLGVSSLTLQGDGYNILARKEERNYFFVRVNP